MKEVGGALSDNIRHPGQKTLAAQSPPPASDSRRKLRCVSVASFCLLTILTGCGEELSCSATPTKQLVDQITRDQLKKQLPSGDPQPDQVVLSVNEIITTDKTKTRAQCKAKLQMSMPGAGTAPVDTPITYHVEKTDDGRLYVTVFGL